MVTRVFQLTLVFISAAIYLGQIPCLSDEPKTADAQTEKDAQAEKQDGGSPLYGRIVDNEGNPVTDARLTLQGPRYLRTETDDEGRYEFIDVTIPGSYRLEVKSNKWVGIIDYDKMPQLAIDPDATQEKNLTLSRACQVKLEVVDEAGKPVSATIYHKSMAKERYRSGERSSTDKQGIAVIGGLEPSSTKYAIGVQSESHAFGHLIIDAGNPDVIEDHRIVLKNGKTVKCKAVCSDGKPPAGWRVNALPTWWAFGVYPRGPEIAKDGTFDLQHIGDDNYNVSISIPMGDGMTSMRPVLTDAPLAMMKQPVPIKLDYPSPSSMNYLNCKIRWIGQPLDKGFSISGYSSETRHHISHYVKKGLTEVKVGPIPKGTYRIRPEDPAIEVMNLRKIKNLVDLDHVKVPNQKPIQIVLRVRGKPHVQGTVIDAKTKKPITLYQYRMVKIRTLEGPNYVQDDEWKLANSEDGSFRSDVVGPGIYVVSVLADGFAIKTSEQVNTIENPDQLLKFELIRGHTLRGKVVDQQGKPVNGAKVRALSLAGGAMPRVIDRFVTDQGAASTVGGEFTIENLNQGAETLRVDHPDFVFNETSGIKVGEESEPVTITLTTGATIRGRVFDQDGKPQPNETLFFQDSYGYGGGDREAGRLGQATTDQEGRYEVHHIPEMPVYVSRAEEWNSLGVVRHALLAEDGKVHTLNFGGTTRLDGQFIVNDKPLADTRLQLTGSDSIFGAMKMYVRTKNDGRFTFFGAPPGYWTLYRQLEGTRSEFTKVRDVEVPAGDDLDLGTIKQKVGRLTVACQTTADALPERLQMELQAYNAEDLFGRPAATLLPRETAEDPFVLENVSPGDYELVCNGAGEFQIRERLKITAAEIDATIPFSIPHGTASVSAEFRTAQGPMQGMLMMWSEDERMLQYVNAKTDEDGKTTRHEAQGLPAGKYTFRTGNTRNTPVIHEFEVADGEQKRFTVTLGRIDVKPRGYATIRATDQEGMLVPVLIKFAGENGDQIRQSRYLTETKLVGPPGKLTVQIEHSGFEAVETDIELGGTNNKTAVVLKRTAK